MSNKGLQINDTVRTYPRTLMEAFPGDEPYAIEHYRRKSRTWPWLLAAAFGWGYLCWHLV